MRQADHEISLGCQESHIRAWATKQAYDLSDIYIEPGASGRSDRRPVFQRMIADALRKPRPFEFVLILNFSRFFRDEFGFERYRRLLAAAGVMIESVTQPVPNNPSGKLARGVTTLFDAYASDVTAEQVKIALAGNAARGFWNGAVPPFGYKSVTVQRFANKDKKQLRVEEHEASIIRLIFDLYLERCGNYGQSSIMAITDELRKRELRLRGKPIKPGIVGKILRRSTYLGTHYYNQLDTRTRLKRPPEEWIPIDVPAIVNEETFKKAQIKLDKSHPKVTAARTVNARNLTTGLVKCGEKGCGANMTAASDKGRRYLICERRRAGGTACSSRRIRMEQVDSVVIDTLSGLILAPERLEALLKGVLQRSDTALAGRRIELRNLRRELTAVEGFKFQLLECIERGQVNAGDDQVKERFREHDARMLNLGSRIALLQRQTPTFVRRVSANTLECFAQTIRRGLHSRDATLRNAYVRLFLQQITLTAEKVSFQGTRRALDHAVFITSNMRAGVSLTGCKPYSRRLCLQVAPALAYFP